VPERIIGSWYAAENRVLKEPVELEINDEALSKRGIYKVIALFSLNETVSNSMPPLRGCSS
jgi:hypothetical protein